MQSEMSENPIHFKETGVYSSMNMLSDRRKNSTGYFIQEKNENSSKFNERHSSMKEGHLIQNFDVRTLPKSQNSKYRKMASRYKGYSHFATPSGILGDYKSQPRSISSHR